MRLLLFSILCVASVSSKSDKGKQISGGSNSGSPVHEVQPVHSDSDDVDSSSSQGHHGASSSYQVPQPLWYSNQATDEGFRRWSAIPFGHQTAEPGFFPFCPLMPHGSDPHDHTCLVVRSSITTYRTGGRSTNAMRFNDWWQSTAGGAPRRADPTSAKTLRQRFGASRAADPAGTDKRAITSIGQVQFTWSPELPHIVVVNLEVDVNALSYNWRLRRGTQLLALNIGWRLDYRVHHLRPWHTIEPLGSSEHPHGFPDPSIVPIDPRTGLPTINRFGRFTWEVNEQDPMNSPSPSEIILHYSVDSLRPIAFRHAHTNEPMLRASPYLVFYMTAWEEPVVNALQHVVVAHPGHGRGPSGSSSGPK